MHFTVKVNGELRDSRTTSLDLTTLLAAIRASADVKDSVALLENVPVGAVLRFELNQRLCFFNRLSKVDVSNMMGFISKTYVDMGSCKFTCIVCVHHLVQLSDASNLIVHCM